MSSTASRVCVIIAARNAARTIPAAIASALREPEAAEVVVVDDASGDDGATLAAAHAELSRVFWEKFIVEFGLKTGNVIIMFAGMAAWFGATAAVLLGIDMPHVNRAATWAAAHALRTVIKRRGFDWILLLRDGLLVPRAMAAAARFRGEL